VPEGHRHRLAEPGLDATVALAEHLAAHGYDAIPRLSARLVRDSSHLDEDRRAARGISKVMRRLRRGDLRETSG
jgi:hypothetical protein